MRKHIFHALPLLLATLLLATACGSTKIFHANFNSDTLGSLPNENPPGEPAGDLIYFSGGDTANPTNQLAIVNTAPFSSQSLRYANANVPVFYRYVGFISKEVSLAADKTFYAYWNGVVDLAPGGSGLQVWLGNSHFLAIATLQFKDGQIRLQTTTGASPAFENIGPYVEGTSHFILMTVNKAAGTYEIAIIQSGGNNFNTGTRPVLNPAALNTQRPSLYMWFYENASGSGQYLVDNVTISEKEPES